MADDKMHWWDWQVKYWPRVWWMNLSCWWRDRKVVRYGKVRGTLKTVVYLARHDVSNTNRIIALERRVKELEDG